jgi:hypothetical protein
MEAYLSQVPEDLSLQPFIIGIDCVSASQSRLKVYVRSPRTSFSFTRNVMTLGGRRNDPLERVSGQFHHLWKLTLGLRDNYFPESRKGAATPESFDLRDFDVAPKCAVKTSRHTSQSVIMPQATRQSPRASFNS